MLFILFATFCLTSASVLKSEINNPTWMQVARQGRMSIGSDRIKRYIKFDDSGINDIGNAKPVVCNRPGGKPGICRALHHCGQEQNKNDIKKFIKSLCIFDILKIGSCCPDDREQFGTEGLAGELPATASKTENKEILLKIERAENRGCGFSTRPIDQITGPEAARVWPWMASATIIGVKHYCGGSLITDRHILTAAHCFHKEEAADLEVRLGEYDFKRTNDTRTYIFKVEQKIAHEEFDRFNHKNDIAILKFNRPAVFNTYVWPICLPPAGLELVNQTAMLIGWGTVKFAGPQSPVLKEVDIPIWDLETCQNSLTDTVFEENYCAASYTGGKDACQYDSGSPLMYEMPSGRWAAVGIVSWGVRCGEVNHPGLYTRVDKYLKWISLNTQ